MKLYLCTIMLLVSVCDARRKKRVRAGPTCMRCVDAVGDETDCNTQAGIGSNTNRCRFGKACSAKVSCGSGGELIWTKGCRDKDSGVIGVPQCNDDHTECRLLCAGGRCNRDVSAILLPYLYCSATSTMTVSTTGWSGPKWKTDECGKSFYSDAGEGLEFQIIGGDFARKHEFPWQVRLRASSVDGGWTCGGSLISECWVLTAAHCVVDDDNFRLPASAFEIILGEHVISDGAYIADRGVSEVHIPTEPWDAATSEDDIALLRLDQPVVFNENMTNICPPEDKAYNDTGVTVSGWGRTDASNQFSASDVLKYTNIKTISNAACNSLFGFSAVTDGMICTWDSPDGLTTDSCQGDSGGPVAYKDGDANGCFRLVGLVSWGFGCAAGTPGVNARVSEYLDWIEEC